MNKVTQAVIDLGGEWPERPNREILYKYPGGVYQANIGAVDVNYTGDYICTRQEFDTRLMRLRGDFAKEPDEGVSFNDWLKGLGNTSWPTDSRIDAIGQNGPTGEHYDAVEHPKHYKSHPSGIECIQITEHMGFNLGNATKYIWRCDEKLDAIEDLKKAKWYIEREIAKREKMNAK